MNNKTLAHIGLGLVTYGALLIYLLFTLTTATSSDISEIFTSGLMSFLGFFATFMTFFGWILIIPALIISIRGLAKKDNIILNGITLAFSVGWFIAGYWVMTHFA